MDIANGGRRRWLSLGDPHGSLGNADKLVFSPDGTRLHANLTGHIGTWDVATGKRLRAFRPGALTPYTRFNPAGTGFASYTYQEGHPSEVTFWKFGDSLGPMANVLRAHENDVLAVAFHPREAQILSGGDEGVKLWDAVTGNLLINLGKDSPAPNVMTTVDFSPDGARFAWAAWDGLVHICETKTGRELSAWRGHTNYILGVAFSPDGRRLVSVGNELIVWDAESGRALHTIPHPFHPFLNPHPAQFTAGGRRIVARGVPHTLAAWDSATGEAVGHGPELGHFSVPQKTFTQDTYLQRLRRVRQLLTNEFPTLQLGGGSCTPDWGIELANLGDRPRCLVWNYGSHFRGQAAKIIPIGPAFEPDRWYHIAFDWSYHAPTGQVAIQVDDKSYTTPFEFVPGTAGPGRFFLFGHVETVQPDGCLHFRNFRADKNPQPPETKKP